MLCRPVILSLIQNSGMELNFWIPNQVWNDECTSRMIVISPMVNEKAMKIAKELQIEVYSYADSVKP